MSEMELQVLLKYHLQQAEALQRLLGGGVQEKKPVKPKRNPQKPLSDEQIAKVLHRFDKRFPKHK